MMKQITSIPKIELYVSEENLSYAHFKGMIQDTLLKILPDEFFEINWSDVSAMDENRDHLYSLLPLSHYTTYMESGSYVSFFLLSKFRAHSFKFFFEMISRWLVPGKRLSVTMSWGTDFSFPDLGKEIYTICEIMVHIESQNEWEEVLRNLPIIETEIALGVESPYFARRILEIKGITSDEKTSLIQEYISYIANRLPKEFDHHVFAVMQHVLVLCPDEFKAKREVRHLSRIICLQYLFRNSLRKSIAEMPDKRHLSLKIFKAKINNNGVFTSVLGIFVVLNFLNDKEILEETHLIKAVQNYIPLCRSVEDSFLFNKLSSENLCTLYLEIEKIDGEDFTGAEIQLLRNELPDDLDGRVEHLMHPVFMPRNEEEIMRNILSLSNQIKYLRDIPQMFVSFDEQTHNHLFFTIILVRVAKPGTQPVQDMFKDSGTFLEYIHDRCKTVGFLRKKYRKEVTVFRVKVPKDQFLRRDHSIDLYKARYTVVNEISRLLGDVRDFNGGMISKQNELLVEVKNLIGNNVKYSDLLLENFFYSINPVIMRTVLEPETLKKLFLMLLQSISEGFEENKNYALSIRVEPQFVYIIAAAEDVQMDDAISEVITQLEINPTSLTTSYIASVGILYYGYLYRSEDPIKQRKFCTAIQNLFNH